MLKYFLRIAVTCLTFILLLVSCSKDKRSFKVPFLTGRTWLSDTITINPPGIYSSLSPSDQQAYNQSLAWFKNGKARLTFNEDGTVTCGGDWDWGYKTWSLANNNTDIEVLNFSNSKQLLKRWAADASRFSYTITINNSVDCSLFYK